MPTAVYAETVMQGQKRGHANAFLIRAAIEKGYLTVADVHDVEIPLSIVTLPLDAGEKQAIFLALREKADLILLDDLKAREEAQTRGLPVKGTLGVLVEAYRKNFLDLSELETLFEVIAVRRDIWIAEALCFRVLSELKTK